MTMRMKSRPLYVAIVMAVMSALAVTATTWPTEETTGSLNGKMFTLSRDRGGISFYPPYYYPSSSTRPYYTTNRPYYTTTTTRPTPRPTTTRHWTTTTRPTPRPTTTRHWTTTTRPTPRPTTTRPTPRPTRHWTPATTRPYFTTTRPYYTTNTYPWTTAPATRGVSVCLRYLAESVSSLFTLSKSSRAPLTLDVGGAGSYVLTVTGYRYYSLYFQPNIKFWPNIGPDIWNRVCFTVDSMKNVAQVFSGSNISIRKMLPSQYVWSGEPVMDFSGFDGHLTDVQIWDYPLSYREVFNYMTSGVYAPYQGSALSWSYISYSPKGQTLLEDTFELQGRQPISNRRGKKGRRPKGGKKTRKFYNVWESKSEQV
ncbi:hypothetical protein VZT92_013687 [Zoarces viviparus]|uniref:Uncharacterized protein n=1 Tax=Zoarces viviparus TaxID=48416 RepID=A0AAW1F4M1_ZOAVI